MPELRRLLFLRPNIPSFREMLCPLPLFQMERASLECLQQPLGMSGSNSLLARGYPQSTELGPSPMGIEKHNARHA